MLTAGKMLRARKSLKFQRAQWEAIGLMEATSLKWKERCSWVGSDRDDVPHDAPDPGALSDRVEDLVAASPTVSQSVTSPSAAGEHSVEFVRRHQMRAQIDGGSMSLGYSPHWQANVLQGGGWAGRPPDTPTSGARSLAVLPEQ